MTNPFKVLLGASTKDYYSTIMKRISSKKSTHNPSPFVISSAVLMMALISASMFSAILLMVGNTEQSEAQETCCTIQPSRISVGAVPEYIAFNQETGQFFVLNYGSSSVSVIDSAENKVVANIKVESNNAYNDIAVDSSTNLVYLADAFGFWVIDPEANSILTEFEFTNEMGTGYMHKIVVSEGNVYGLTSTEIMIFSQQADDELSYSFQRIDMTDLEDGSPTDIEFNPDSNKIYALFANNDLLYVFDALSHDLVAKVKFGHDSNSLAINPTTNRIYVAGENTVTVIDGTTNKPLPFVVELEQTGALHVAVDSKRNFAYVANYAYPDVSFISVIDGSENSVHETVELDADLVTPAVDGEVVELAVNLETGIVYVITRPNWYTSTERPGSVIAIENKFLSGSSEDVPELTLTKSMRSVSVDGKAIDLEFESSSDIEEFEFDQESKQISYTLSGHEATEGTTIITIGAVLIGPYVVMIDGNPITDFEVIDNGAKIKLTYANASEDHPTTITGTQVVPEFPISVLVMSAALGSIVILTIVGRNMWSREKSIR